MAAWGPPAPQIVCAYFTEGIQRQLSPCGWICTRSAELIHLRGRGTASSVRKATYFHGKTGIKADVGIPVPPAIERQTDSCFSFLAKG